MRLKAEAVRRLPYLAALAVGLVFLPEALSLPVWDVFGAGPGLFPTAVIILILVVAAALSLLPRLAGPTLDDEADGEGADEESGRLFWFTCAALPLMAVASAYLGFILISIGMSLLLVWQGERRRLLPALAFGVICGLVGVLGFELVLGVNLPTDNLDRLILRTLR